MNKDKDIDEIVKEVVDTLYHDLFDTLIDPGRCVLWWNKENDKWEITFNDLDRDGYVFDSVVRGKVKKSMNTKDSLELYDLENLDDVIFILFAELTDWSCGQVDMEHAVRTILTRVFKPKIERFLIHRGDK